MPNLFSTAASPLISEMLNVNPTHRANIKAICSHAWINETYSDLCLDVAEDLARQTPVRLDLLLSLTAPAVNSEKIMVGADQVNHFPIFNLILLSKRMRILLIYFLVIFFIFNILN